MTMEKPLRTLLHGLIDYAGLFPPASLDMPGAARRYALYLRSPEAPWLGRFVLPVARLGELSRAWESLDPSARGAAPAGGSAQAGSVAPPGRWRLSALIGPDPAADFRAIGDFNRAAAGVGPVAAGAAAEEPQRPVIDVLEMKVASAAEAEAAMAGKPAGVTAYLEVPIHEDPAPLLAAIARAGGRAKVRTGGVTADMIPAPETLARFLAACARAGVPFKATAGLHHPVRSRRPLTYAPDSPVAVMHGFLNVFLAAAFAAEGMDEKTLAALLAEESPRAFRFDGEAVRWRDHALPEPRLRLARRDFAIAFGSCSFEEPREDLREADLL